MMPSPNQSPNDSERSPLSRRRVIQTGLLTAGVTLAGCSSTTQPEESPSDEPTTAPDSPGEPPTDTTPSETPASGPVPPQGPWPTAHGNSANTGAISEPGPQGTPSVRWRKHVQLGTRTRAATGPNGPVATVEDGTVVAYAPDGSRRWVDRHAGTFRAAPVVAPDGTVIVGRHDGTVIAYEPNGERRWERSTPEGLFAPHANDATPFRVASESVVLAHPRAKLYRFSLADGTGWTVEAPARGHRPAVADGRVFLTGGHPAKGSEGVVVAYALKDGSQQWRKAVDRSISIAPGVGNGLVYTADIDGLVVAHAPADGSEQWRVRIEGEPWISTIPLVFDGRIWIGTLDKGLYAVTESGVEQHVGLSVAGTPAVGNGRLYVGTDDAGTSGAGRQAGTIAALDSAGEVRWRTRTRGVPVAQVDHRDGTVVAGARTGVVEQLGASDGRRQWRDFERPPTLPSPAVGPATVYCGDRGDIVTGYRSTDGTSHLWAVRFDGSPVGAPTVAGNTVLANGPGAIAGTPPLEYADPPGRLTATPTPRPDATPTPHIDAPKPEPRWRRSLGGRLGALGYQEYGYLGSGNRVVSIAAGGATRWETAVGASVRRAPAIADGTVYATTVDGTLVALSAADGTEQWRQSVGTTATAPAVVDGTAVVGTPAGIIAAASGDGTEQWRTEVGRVRSVPAVTADLVVTGADDGVLRGLELGDGTERWRVETGGPIHGSPAVADGVVYAGSRDRHLYAVTAANGEVDWRYELGDWVDGSPAIGHGAVFVVDQTGALTAIVGDQ